MRSSAKFDRHCLPLLRVRLGKKCIDVGADGYDANRIGVDLAENGAKSADTAGISQAASTLVYDGAL
jgi:hypothetical protein